MHVVFPVWSNALNQYAHNQTLFLQTACAEGQLRQTLARVVAVMGKLAVNHFFEHRVLVLADGFLLAQDLRQLGHVVLGVGEVAQLVLVVVLDADQQGVAFPGRRGRGRACQRQACQPEADPGGDELQPAAGAGSTVLRAGVRLQKQQAQGLRRQF